MPDQHVTVAVTGAAGQIGYALVFRIASGQVFGPQTTVELRLLELEAALPSLEGVAMELEDCAFPLLRGVVTTASADEAFRGANWALLVGAVPRKAGMERKDLLGINAGIFAAQGRSIAANAADDVRVLVVGNPCNTNCLIAAQSAPDIPRDRWFAMTMLDETRGRALLARRAGVTVAEVRDLVIWGNHSSTQFPDAYHATIGGRAAAEVINDDAWLPRRVHHHRPAAGSRDHRGARPVVRGLRRQRGDRDRPQRGRPDRADLLRRRALARGGGWLRRPGRAGLRLPAARHRAGRGRDRAGHQPRRLGRGADRRHPVRAHRGA